MAATYSIRDWNKHYECSQSRKIEKALSWVPVPTKHDGKGYRRLISRQDGPALYGAWILIVQVAAKCDVRGVLADSEGPLTVQDIAIKTGASEELIASALEVLSSKEISWLIRNDATSTLPEPYQNAPTPLPDRYQTATSTLPPPAEPERPALPERKKDQHGKPPAGAFAEIGSDGLRSVETVEQWRLAQIAKRRPVVKDSEQNRQLVHAAAIKATSDEAKAEDPVALFAWIVSGQRWGNIPDRDREEARNRLREFDAKAQPPPFCPVVLKEPPQADSQRTNEQLRKQIEQACKPPP